MHFVESQKVIEEGSNTSKDVGASVKHEPPQGDGSNGINSVAKPESLGNAINSDATSVKPEVVGTAVNAVNASEKLAINDIISKGPERNQDNLPEVSTVPKDDKQEPSEENVSTNDGEPVNQSPLGPKTTMTKSVEKHIRDKLENKSRKLMKHPAKVACLARNMLFVHALRMQKNKKFNEAKKQRLASFEANNMGTGDQASTSAYSNGHAGIKEQKSHKRKRSKSSRMKNREDLPATSVLKEDSKNISSELAHANTDQSKINLRVHLAANNIVIKESEGLKRCESYSLLMQGLKETAVPSWDDIELPKVKMQDAEPSKQKSIGYVLNEWDEEYDRGRRKKVKQSRVDFGGPNPFQESADLYAQQKMKKLKSWIRSGNKPFRN